MINHDGESQKRFLRCTYIPHADFCFWEIEAIPLRYNPSDSFTFPFCYCETYCDGKVFLFTSDPLGSATKANYLNAIKAYTIQNS